MTREVQVFKRGEMVQHGGYGQYAAYDIERFQYAVYDVESDVMGFWELLSIKNPPDGKFPVVIHIKRSDTGGTLFSFRDLEAAHDAWEKGIRSGTHWEKAIRKHSGCMKVEHIGEKQPWFFCPWIEITRKLPSLAPDNIAELWVGVCLPSQGVDSCGRYRIDGVQAMYSLSRQRKEVYDWYSANLPDFRDGILILTPGICREV